MKTRIEFITWDRAPRVRGRCRPAAGGAAFRALAVAGSLLVCAAQLAAQETNTVQAEATDTSSNAVLTVATNATAASEEATSGFKQSDVVRYAQDAEIKAGDSAQDVVVIFGSARIHGKVAQDVVAIFGDVDVDGGEVQGDTVAVMGNVRARQGAKIHGDAVAVGGSLQVAPDSSVKGDKVGLGLPGLHVEWLRSWLVHCGLKLRPLAPQVGWVWAVAGAFFLVYLLVAAVFPRPVLACVQELERRPATTFFVGLLTTILKPLVFLVLAATVIGLVAVPFIWVALLVGCIVGKIALVEWVGIKLGGQLGLGAFQKPLLAFVFGSIIVTLLYMVWVVGLLVFILIGVWGLGIGVTVAFAGLRREMPPRPGPAPINTGASTPAFAGTAASYPADAASAPASETQAAAASMPQSTIRALPEAFGLPRAGLWPRLGAASLDVFLVAIVCAMVGGQPPLGLLLGLAYFAGMWAWKGTTIGGIVLRLKVVRADAQPVSLVTALVRALAGVFSILALFLGILWAAWDPEKQGWHDMIAGTVVVRTPYRMALVSP